jgi:c-di-GMP-binding flagellar brake protein YcgR
MPAVSEARVDPRARVRVPIQVLDTDTHAPRFFIETVDLSAGGAFCRAAEYVPLKNQIRIHIDLPDGVEGRPLITDAVVLRIDRDPDAQAAVGGFLVALYFLNLRYEDRRRLQQFIFSNLQGSTAPSTTPPAKRAKRA